MATGTQLNTQPTFLETVSGMDPNPSFLESLGGLVGVFTGMFIGVGLLSAHIFGDPRSYELLGRCILFVVHMIVIPIACMRFGVKIGKAVNAVVVTIICAAILYLEWLLRGAFFHWVKGVLSGFAGQ